MERVVRDAGNLLRRLIGVKSLSGHERERALLIVKYLQEWGVEPRLIANNILATPTIKREGVPNVLLNSHLDTVKPSQGYSFDPYDPGDDPKVIRGLGSNDAGGALVSMLHVFLWFSGLYKNLFNSNAPNICLLLSAEEENSGAMGISLALKEVPDFDMAIVGEPTQMRGAIAERGLLVLDGVTYGLSGHAARGEGVNALYKAIEDINALREFKFEKSSETMGAPSLAVTQIEAGKQHNVTPDRCNYVVDVRTTDSYSNLEILQLLKGVVKGELIPRNLENKSSSTPKDSPLYSALKEANILPFVSPTTSDWMRINSPAIKMGPGDSARSHAPDEYITIDEIGEGIMGYIKFINAIKSS